MEENTNKQCPIDRQILLSKTFRKNIRKLTERNSRLFDQIQFTIERLEKHAFHSSLDTHKLKGKYSDCYACSVNYSIRIIFQIVDFEGREAVLLLNVGTHDEVYKD